MEFECHETIIDLSKDIGDSVDNIGIDQVEDSLIETLSPLAGIERNQYQVAAFNSKSELKVDKFVASLSSNCNVCSSIIDLPPALISEILNCLAPKELGIVSCVSTILQRIAFRHHIWKEFYCERWGLPKVVPKALPCLEDSEERSWKKLFEEKESRSKNYMGRYSIDVLYGHKEAVRTVFILASAGLVFTSGYDTTVRMWGVEEGSSIATSRSLGCTIRAVSADTKLLVAGGTGGFIHCWRAVEGLPYLFDFNQRDTEFRLCEHEGPITCLALDLTRIYSGSWDMTVRVWDRTKLDCIQVLWHNDWVWSIAPLDNTVATTSGSDTYMWDINSGSKITVCEDAHVGNIYSLARSRIGNLIFTGGEDGAIHMFQICQSNILQRVATWIPHQGPVNSLAFEYPWLVSASSDGKMSLIDMRKLLKTSTVSLPKNVSSRANRKGQVEPPQRMLHGFGCNLFAIDIGVDCIVCAGEEGIVRIWNFTRAWESETMARAQKGIRLEKRMNRRRQQAEMNRKSSRADKCSMTAKKNPLNGDKNIAWHSKRGVSCKLKA